MYASTVLYITVLYYSVTVIFNFSTRVPGEEIDELLHYESCESRHIVVWRQGLFYQLSIYDDKNQLLSVTVLEQFFQDIINDASKHKGKR